MDFGGRKVAFKSLVGSHNYNLNTPESDKDYKVFVIPTFDDLYFNNSFSKSYIGETEDFDAHDIRKCSSLWYKANVNFLEVLFSERFRINSNLCEKSKSLIYQLYDMRNDIARMNLKYLYDACIGMHYNKMKYLEKGTEGTQHLVDKFGYDCYSYDTKFLTDSGWKLYDDITEKDKLATINNETHCIEYQNYTNRIKKTHNGKMYELENAFSNCLVTGNHRMYVSDIVNRNKNGIIYKEHLANWHYATMNELLNNKKSYYHVLNNFYNNNEDYEISDELLTIIGLFVSEGTINFRNNKVKSVRITQTKNGKKEVFDVMDTINSFTRYDYDKETVWICSDKNICNFLYKECGHSSHNKRLPSFINLLSKRQSKILLYALYLGDGTCKKIDDKQYGFVYYTVNKDLADDVQTLALYAEKDTTLWGGENGYKSISNFNNEELYMYQVYIKDTEPTPKYFPFRRCNEKNKEKGVKVIDYNDKVVCFTIPNGNLVTKRKGKVAIQGNCKQALHAWRILDFLRAFADNGFNDFKSAIWYSEDNIKRNFLLDLKNGMYSLNEYKEIVANTFNHVEENYKDKYRSQRLDEDTNNKVLEIIKELVRLNLA